jgi:predicted nucleotidyltransferase component of viral defense system
MRRWIDATLPERKLMLQRTADKERLPEYAVEKDWWVTMTLKAIFNTSCGKYLEFKGGTSLSKGWKLIERMSEDIDLALSHNFFECSTDNNTQLKNLRKKSHRFITAELARELEQSMNALGLKDFQVVPVADDEAGNPISTDADPTVLLVDYHPISDFASPYVPFRVKVEISCLSMDEPFEMKRISSMVSSLFPDEDEDTESVIPVVLPSRTFLEKAFLLNEEFQKDKPRSLRMTRHLYDLEHLMDTEFGKEALSDVKLYAKIVEHRRKFYHLGYADYDKDYPDKIDFMPPEHCISAWKSDYAELLEHFVYGEKISFEHLLERISELQSRFRSLSTSHYFDS